MNSNQRCAKCGGPIGSGSNHEEDRCQDIQIFNLKATVERLEREMAELEKHDSQCIKDRMVFIDEIERLRAALERIATASPKDGVYDGYQDIAREALQGAGTEGETKG